VNESVDFWILLAEFLSVNSVSGKSLYPIGDKFLETGEIVTEQIKTILNGD